MEQKMISYLRDVAKITGLKITIAPRNPYSSGYGKKIPTSKMILIGNNPNWYRVYVIQFSNVGSAYVIYKGKCLFVDDCDFPVASSKKPI